MWRKLYKPRKKKLWSFDFVSSLKHLAIIMDGNGKWAKQKQHHRIFGHIQGMRTALNIIQHCSKMQIPYLSLFALSAENFSRPTQEVENLTKLFKKALCKHSQILFQHQIRFFILGDRSVFSKELNRQCLQLQSQTEKHKGLNLIIALNYGGRQEIVQAFQNAQEYYFDKPCIPQKISEKDLASFFPSALFPDPDLLIRTGGENRLSNFYLWSLAYTELYFTKTLWPVFKAKELDKVIQNFYQRKRNFGLI